MTASHRALFLVAAGMLAVPAYASYGQIRLEGLLLSLAFMLMVGYGLIVDVALFARVFQHRAWVATGTVVAAAIIVLLLFAAASPNEREGFFKMALNGSGPPLLVLSSAVFLPFIVIAPWSQHFAMRDGRRWPRWVGVWMALQLALLPAFVVLTVVDTYFRYRDDQAGQATGRRVEAGGLPALLEIADERPERIWGTGWSYSWRPDPATRPSDWIVGLAMGLEASALVAANEPLGAPDKAALEALKERHFRLFAVPQIRARLLWDALKPGDFSRQLPRIGDETIPVLLDRLAKHGEARFCPGGRMTDADRAALRALILDRGRATAMSAPWDGYQQQVERLCPEAT